MIRFLAKGTASEFYTIFDNDFFLHGTFGSEAPTPK
jgi:hypothetical protein